jgi:hypothetical protein
MKNNEQLNSYFESMVQLLIDKEKDEAFASVTLNPFLTWIKFILTDDKPNLNHQRIPQEEFANLIKSGINMPIKMASKEIPDGHDDSFPIGTITNLVEKEGKIFGLAALWNKERTEDVSFIKQSYIDGKPLNLSWEISYDDARASEETEILDLLGVILKAATFVGMPAYSGRTPILAVASKTNDKENSDMDELEKNKIRIAELEAELTELKKAKDEVTFASAVLEDELKSLREFKASVDKVEKETQAIAAIKTQFETAGIKKEDTYFVENRERLLGMDEDSIKFLLQELVSFVPTDIKVETASTKIPNFTNDDSGKSDDPVKLAEELRKLNKIR